ncbi:ATP-binding protein [Thalassospira xianhensis]|uniref:Type IV secretion protein IcmB n=1 Tax=Thalassospira xianhensis MCCC 1A02616 TaxID=1177929 RepID=A0A367UDA6_9PROT|nr:ATP-binding protein [Thalassospira xianhensis]RCK06306.1 hypothetical protein TH5_08880 [Thalassospira xianhensis MCCC 1A02616]
MSLVGLIDTLIAAGGGLGKKSLASFNFLDTAFGKTLIAKDGSLATLVRIDGIKRMMGGHELNVLVNRANTSLSPYLGRPGHAIQVFFSRDPDLSRDLVKSLNITPRTIAKRLDLNLDDVFEERENVLPNYIVPESFYMVLWTRMSALGKQELKKARVAMKAPPLWPAAANSHNPFLLSNAMTTRHEAFVASFMADLKSFEIRASVTDVHAALGAIRNSIDPATANSNWHPYLPGDLGKAPSGGREAKPRWRMRPEIKSGDISHLLWPKLDDQLFSVDAERINSQIVRIGRYLFSGVNMTVGPQDVKPFSHLLSRLMELEEFPWRASFLLEGDGMSLFGLKNLIAAFAGFSSGDNKIIRDTIKQLKAFEREGGVVVRFRASFGTWAPNGEMNLIESRSSRLQRAVESWGYCNAAPSSGDPLAGVMSSALGLDVASTAPAAGAPLMDALYMMPWDRDASPFEKGSILFRTIDRRIWPFQPGSSQQDTFIDIIYAPPGKGKSVFLNSTSLAFCLSPMATSGAGGAQLPRIAIIDIGPSSSGLISLLKEALPPSRRHEVEYKRLRMVSEHSINPFDTQLGCRECLPMDRATLKNFITMLGTEHGGQAPSGLSQLSGAIIDTLYETFSDKTKKGKPRQYSEGEDLQVDEALRKHNIALSGRPTWWECVDKLFAAGAIREATMAQRYAVPRVEDLMATRTEQIQDIFGSALTESGEPLLKVFNRTISSALREYPILSGPTRFEIGAARIVALDLDEAAPSGGGSADKQTALVYMLGTFVTTRDFYLNDQILKQFPQEYQAYHRLRIQRIRETPKRIVFDEFHRTRNTPQVRQQVVIYMREGRKWGIQISLASQLIGDFDADMISLATSYWIMGANTEQDANEAAATFGLSDTAKACLTHNLRGPGPGGAPLLAVLNMKDGKHEHLLYNTLGPMEIWAFSTTPADNAIRTRLYNTIGPVEARRRLARRFPGGSAKNEVDRRVIERAEQGDTGAETMNGVTEEIVQELMAA